MSGKNLKLAARSFNLKPGETFGVADIYFDVNTKTSIKMDSNEVTTVLNEMLKFGLTRKVSRNKFRLTEKGLRELGIPTPPERLKAS